MILKGENVSKYLYGASVQGIQEFIFKTNQLQEIVGASEIVKSLEQEFMDFANIDKDKILLNAAGNIKAIFESEDKLKDVVKEFPKKIMQKAFGITISQAVVLIADTVPTKEELSLLEQRLKTQRNKPSLPLDLTLNVMELAPKTARPLFRENKKQKSDIATAQKRDEYAKWFRKKRKEDKKFVNLKELSQLSNGKNKLAVIHADGNGLGQLIPNLKMPLSEFSKKLDDATRKAFDDARDNIMDIREVILGGDDLTVICNANNALEFTRKFLANFEEKTKGLGNGGLTACAGIAYCNEKFPFHYAVDLAEALCSATKKHAKKLVENTEIPAPSSLMFHNVQSSNFQSWEKFIKDELTIKNDQETIRCDFGAYYVNQEGQASIENLIATLQAYAQEGSPISSLRSWMSELHKSHQSADNMLKRIDEMASKNPKWDHEAMDKTLKKLHSELSTKTLIVSKDKEKDCHGVEKELLKTHIYDILQILSATEAK